MIDLNSFELIILDLDRIKTFDSLINSLKAKFSRPIADPINHTIPRCIKIHTPNKRSFERHSIKS